MDQRQGIVVDLIHAGSAAVDTEHSALILEDGRSIPYAALIAGCREYQTHS